MRCMLRFRKDSEKDSGKIPKSICSQRIPRKVRKLAQRSSNSGAPMTRGNKYTYAIFIDIDKIFIVSGGVRYFLFP